MPALHQFLPFEILGKFIPSKVVMMVEHKHTARILHIMLPIHYTNHYKNQCNNLLNKILAIIAKVGCAIDIDI